MSNFSITTQSNGGRSFDNEEQQDRYHYRSKKNRGRRGRGGKNNNQGGVNPRSRLEDEDVNMEGDGDTQQQTQKRYNPYRYSKIRPGRYKTGQGRDNTSAVQRLGLPVASTSQENNRGRRNTKHQGRRGTDSGWHKITIPYGKKTEKDVILTSLTQITDVPFKPIQYSYEGQNATFFVNNSNAANALRRCSRKITLPTGFKMLVVATESRAPEIEMTEDVQEKLKVAMSNRYEPSTKSLNLSNLYNDSELTKCDLHLPLNKKAVGASVLKIIKNNIPELEILDVSNNRLMSLDSLALLPQCAPNVTHLNIGLNMIKSDRDLETIKDMNLVELRLEGNPLCSNYKDDSLLTSAVRKIFPKLMNLDGRNLPAPITFDIESTTNVPPTKGSFFMNPDVKNLVSLFLDQYFKLYDSNNRSQLIDAYHDNAIFSLCATYNPAVTTKQQSLQDYINVSRNLKRVNDPVKRQRALKSEKLNIVALLNDLPSTQHDPMAFVVDVIHASSNLMSFIVHGVFKEPLNKSHYPPMRSFSRTFVCAPQGSGMVIVNEEFNITNASPAQVKKSFQSPAPTPSSSPVLDSLVPPTLAPITAGPAAATAGVATSPQQPVAPGVSPEQQQMIDSFSKESGMNLEWSYKCLAECAWNYENAAKVFLDLKSKGSIPPEAFK